MSGCECKPDAERKRESAQPQERAQPSSMAFIADVMVGKLARWLRVLGVDVAYSNAYEDDEIIRIATAQSRIVLTRECNVVLKRVSKESVFEKVPPYVYLTQERFALCPSCNRVFWHGTHADQMLKRIRS